ncbi:hypothetical protein [Thioclava sp. GXIMD4216]|uniref:hypothetical protein n=1 Tax=Thioclava sp. GXIMD4216 TaxID=3131929 RepID=UPI0030CB298F
MKKPLGKTVHVVASGMKYSSTLVLTGLSIGVAFGLFHLDVTPQNVFLVIALVTCAVVGAVTCAFFNALAASRWVFSSRTLQRIHQAYPAAMLLNRAEKAAFMSVLSGALVAEYLMLMSLA